ncbi:23S rRNA (uracil(1939)-C(5))-methyltransferase RlmD [Massilia sp. W12]|uniref:23S rRNA (uracil(1939)-C(5))-methyltransferase RlmD n=1 Tax=Massilia sp. W12 TaxID=3126507 RepID=UPI0030CAC6B2
MQQLLEIESLDMEARGVAHLPNEDGSPGKVIFVEGALPGERVEYSSFKKKKSHEFAQATKLHKQSSLRVEPRCPHFGMCGGCAMQHLEPSAQVAVKQRVLEDNLAHIGKVKPEQILSAIHGPTWGYRYRARLSVRHVRKKGEVLVGFHEKRSVYVADIKSCAILPPHVSDLLLPLRKLIAGLSIIEDLPQIELAVGEEVTVLVLRIMQALTEADEQALKAFADQHKVQFWLQTKGPDTAKPFYPLTPELYYLLPEFGVRMPFKPTDFTQVNHHINRVLVARALRLLDAQPQERILDLFCGLGNFTLPLATQAAQVVGIEGSEALTARSLENAQVNGLAHKLSFRNRNLFEMTPQEWQTLGQFDRMLIDPPRDGAQAVCESLAGVAREFKPRRIVYVSCSPSTLARDAGILVHQAGYHLRMAGVVNMFPHTSHVESMAVFELV